MPRFERRGIEICRFLFCLFERWKLLLYLRQLHRGPFRDGNQICWNVERTLVSFTQSNFTQKQRDAVVHRSETFTQNAQQFRVGRRIVRMMQIKRMNQSAAKHVSPQSIRDVLIKCLVSSIRCEFRQFCSTTEFRYRLYTVRRCHLIFVSRQKEWFVNHCVVRHSRTSAVLRAFHKHGFKRQITASTFRLQRNLFVALFSHHSIARGNIRQKTVVVGLKIVCDNWMVMTLRALHVASEKDAADIMSQQIGL